MKKKSLFIIILIIVVVIGLRFLFSNEKKESVSAEDVIYNELIEYAKEIDETYSINVFYSDTEEESAMYTLKTIRELTGKKIEKLSMCAEESTYIEIYVKRKASDRYDAVLDCNFDSE